MSEVEKAVRKFQLSASPVRMTAEEHLALCSFYGAIKPSDYENPFMGKVIEIYEPEFSAAETDSFELPLETFLPEEDSEPHFVPPLADELDEVATAEEDQEYDEEELIEEDPFA